MNKKFKFASAFLSAGLLITPVSGLVNQYDNVAKAEYDSNQKNKNELDIKFEKFSFKTKDYEKEKIKLNYKNFLNKEEVEIIEISSNKILEKITVTKDLTRSNVYSSYLTRTFYHGDTSIILTIPISLYKSGSFGEIVSVNNGTNVAINGQNTNYKLENVSANAWKVDHNRVDFFVNGNIIRAVDSSINVGVDADFIFSFSIGKTNYYTKLFTHSGSITLY